MLIGSCKTTPALIPSLVVGMHLVELERRFQEQHIQMGKVMLKLSTSVRNPRDGTGRLVSKMSLELWGAVSTFLGKESKKSTLSCKNLYEQAEYRSISMHGEMWAWYCQTTGFSSWKQRSAEMAFHFKNRRQKKKVKVDFTPTIF